MNAQLIATLALNEVRLRLRRVSTLVALLVTAMVSWAVIVDPKGGQAMMVIEGHRVLYTSSALAVGSAVLAGFLFGLGGFYLVRGRIGEDLRSGTGGVIGATPVSNASFLFARWCGAVAYLGMLVAAFMATMVVLHLVRGDGPLQLGVYLGTYAMLLLPMILYTASFAILFDSLGPLMGKGGDVLYFFIWIVQFSVVAGLGLDGKGFPWPTLFDVSGIVVAARTTQDVLHTTGFAIGASPYDPAKAVMELPPLPWGAQAIVLRLGAVLVAMLPLLPAALLFHRFSPDRVKAGKASARRSPLALANRWLRPLGRAAQPLFALAARLPGRAGQVLAELALSVSAAPLTLLAWLGVLAATAMADARQLGQVVAVSVMVWGILVAGVATRDFEADTEGMTASMPGGELARLWRHGLAAWASGLLFTGVALARWADTAPLRALALAIGVFALSALATFLGRASRSLRTFLGPFLFFIYVMLNEPANPWLDLVGAHGVMTPNTMAWHLGLGVLALGCAWLHLRYKEAKA